MLTMVNECHERIKSLLNFPLQTAITYRGEYKKMDLMMKGRQDVLFTVTWYSLNQSDNAIISTNQSLL